MGFNNKKRKSNIFEVIPFLILLLLYPLFEIPLKVRNRYSGYYFAPGREFQFDLYLVGKMWVLFFLSIWILIIVISNHRKNIKIKTFVPEFLLIIFLLISSFFSVDPVLSFTGANELFEPLPVILCYFIIYFGSFVIVTQKVNAMDRLRLVLFAVVIGSGVLSLIGLGQFFRGQDVVSTLYNADYVGSYFALVIPALTVILLGNKKKKTDKYWYILLSVTILNITVLFLSKSEAGVLACIIGTMTGCIIFIFKKPEKIIAILFLLGLIISISIIVIIWSKIYVSYDYPGFSLATGGEYAEFSFRGEKILIKEEYNSEGDEIFILYNQDGKQIDYLDDSENETFSAILPQASSFYGFHFNPMELKSGLKGFIVFFADKQWYLGMDKEGKCRSVNAYGKYVDFEISESAGIFEGRESFLHGRGYIWDRTIPLGHKK